MKIKPLSIVGLLCLMNQTIVLAQEQNPALVVRVVLSQNAILPYESLGVASTLTNESTKLQVSEGWQPFQDPEVGVFPLYIRRQGQAESIGYSRSLYAGTPPLDSVTRTFQPGQTVKSFMRADTYSPTQHLFDKPGRYQIIAGSIDWTRIPALLEVKTPTGEDVKAYQYLSTHSLYHLFSVEAIEQALEAQGSPDYPKPYPQKELDEFIIRFPKSRYAQWARLAKLFVREAPLRWWWVSRAQRRSPEQLEEMRQIRREMQLLAPQLSPVLRAMAWYEAGDMATLLGDMAGSEGDFKKALATKADPTMPRQIELLKRRVKRIWYWAYQPPKPDPQEIVHRTIRDLEARGYDVQGFYRNHPVEDKQLFRESSLWAAKRNRFEITEEEYYRKDAELLKHYITKYSKPLPLEEWKRRQEQYAKEAQQTQQTQNKKPK